MQVIPAPHPPPPIPSSVFESNKSDAINTLADSQPNMLVGCPNARQCLQWTD